jgi:hypothetical protein
MKKVAMTVVGVLALAASANAQGTWYTDRATWESLLPKRLMGLAISTLLITFIAAAAHADDVLTLGTATDYGSYSSAVTSSYTFNSSMILNSIGFVSSFDYYNTVYSYSINGGTYTTVSRTDTQLATRVNNVRWFSLANPITLNATDVVRVFTQRTAGDDRIPKIKLRGFTVVPSFYITVVGNDQSQGARTNSNLRVSALAPNIAPEPGSLALALTGGFALVGMCIRRRRMSN